MVFKIVQILLKNIRWFVHNGDKKSKTVKWSTNIESMERPWKTTDKKETVKKQTETDQVKAQIPLLKQKFCLITILTFLQARFPFLSHLGSDVWEWFRHLFKNPSHRQKQEVEGERQDVGGYYQVAMIWRRFSLSCLALSCWPLWPLPSWAWAVRVTVETPSTNLVLKRTLALVNMPSFRDTTMNCRHKRDVTNMSYLKSLHRCNTQITLPQGCQTYFGFRGHIQLISMGRTIIVI